MSNRKTFRLSAGETEYVSDLVSKDSSFKSVILGQPEYRTGSETLILDQEGAELLRDYFTERLARVGFDASYAPNEEGTMLERLIDKLFLSTEEWLA